MLVPSALAIAAAFWIAWLVALAAEKRLLDRAIARWRSLPWLGKCAVALVLAGSIAFAGTKPPSGDGPAITNEVCGVDGDATNHVGGVMTLGLSGGATGLGVGATGGEDDGTEPEVPANAPISHLSRITHSMCAAGFVLQSVGTDETFDFSAPPGAFVATNWVRHGAATARVPVGLPDWTFPFGDGYVTNLAVFANGVVIPDVADTNRCFSPFSALLGVVPEANWDGLDADSRPSVFWRTMTDGNSVVCTWQNVLLGRMPDRPVSFQVEFLPHGSFVYRYDLSRLPSEACLSNVTVGVKNGDGEWFAPSVGRSLTSLRFARVTPDDLTDPDRDGDGIPTEAEIFDLGTDPGLPDSDFDGIPDGDEVAAGLDPLTSDVTDAERLERVRACSTNVSEAVSVVTNALVAQGLFGAFAATVPAGSDAVLWERTFPIGKSNPWQQYFVSAAPDRAEGWMLEGLRLEWEDSAGGSGVVVRSPSGDSWRIPVSEGTVASVTLRLRATAGRVRSALPLHLLSYVQQVRIGGGREVACGGVTYSVFTDGAGSAVGVTVDRSDRPHRGPLSAEESDMGLLGGLAAVGVMYEGDGSGGTLRVSRPGAYALPEVPVPTMSPALRRVSRAGGGRVLLVLDPIVWYGEDHCSPVWGCDYDWDDDWYSVDRSYPLDSRCLRRGWHHGRGGEWECACEPGVSTGLGDGGPPELSSSLTVDGDRCSGYVRVGDETVWSGSAVHAREGDCGVVGEFTGEEPFDGGCDSCSEGCGDGNCDALETPTLGSLKFRIPLGTPRRGQVSGFVYLDTSVPMTVSPSSFRLLARDDADVTETESSGARRIVCADERGRDITVEGIANGVRVTILTTSSQALEHRWEITNEDGDGSRIRLRKISSQSNVMEDWTFTYADGDWTRFDNVSQVREELVLEDDLNGGSRTVRELRTKYDANGNFLESTESCRSLVGSCDNAVVRETWRSENSGLNCRWQSAEYWDDPQSGRHGKVRLLTSNHRAWEYSDYDSFGRVTIRIRQRGASRVPASFPAAVSGEPSDCSMLADAFVTVYDYEAHEGDDGASDDFRNPRTVSEFVVTDGVATLVSRRWHRYTRNPRGGISSVRRETWRAVSQTSVWGDDGLPYSYETTLDANAPGVPLVARGDTVESLDENGVLAETEVSVVEGRVVEATRRSRNGVPFDTYRVVEKDAVHGNVLRRAELTADDDTVISDEQSIYDSQNRLRSTAFLDGTSLTNHYSCCRLLWARDRENRRTLRSARTGEDHLYWATEDVWLQELSTNGLYRVTQHFFDALGRETNTVIYAGMTPGEANDWTASEGKAYSSATTQYPFGGSDYVVVTDVSGKVTERRTDLFDECVETGETILTNGIVVTRTKTRTYFGGRTTSRREWGGGRFVEERRFEEYAADGRRVEYVVTESHDCGTVTNSVTVYDLLGRVVSQTVPGANGAWIETRSFYDGASGRLVRTEVDGSPDVTYGYDARGERIATAQNDIVNRVVTSYETVSGEVWQVRASTRIAPGADDVVSTERVQLTGLSDALRSRRVSVSASGKVTRTESSFDAADNAVSTIVSADGVETESSRSSCGLLISASTIDGSESRAYDAFGRVATVSSFAVGADAPRARQSFVYDVSGNVVATDSDYGAEGTAMSSSVFDVLGREVSATDLSARTVETGYDGLGRTVSVGGDTHPLMSACDSAGRKTQGLTTRDGGETWDATTWTFDPRSGLNTAKRYADGSQISYAYTDNGRKTRTTWARGVWKENAYDAANRISGVTYSDGTPGMSYSYTGAGKVSEAAVADGAQTVYGYDGRLLCTSESVSVGADRVDVVRTYDDRSRCDFVAVEVTNVVHAVKTRRFDAYGRVVGYGITNACGRGMAASLQYTGSRVDGIAYMLSNGGTFTSSFTRSASRPDLVTRRDYRFGEGSIYWYETGYDLADRPTNAVDSVSLVRAYLYNCRNELAEALVGTNAFGYAYDTIGNRTSDTLNGMSRSYAANCLNQYAQIDAAQMAYDADGNLVRDDRFAYAYDAENRMLSARSIAPSEGDLAVVNAYDHKHRRIMKRVERFDGEEWQTSETHAFAYDGCNIVLERIAFADDSIRTVEYFWGNDLSGTEQGAGGVGGLLAVSIDGAFFIPCYDHNGNIVCYVSESGTIAAQYVYDPYGNVIEAVGSDVDIFSFGFSTKYLDREVDLVGYQYRFLRPSLGRWLNRDPIGEEGGENLYVFCSNAPNRLYDVLGLACRLGTFNVLSLVIDAKPAMNGLSYNPNLIQQGESLLQSLGMLDLLSAPASLMTGSALSRLISALDIAAGKMSSPDNNAMKQIRRLLEKLKSGPIEVYGKLEYEMCECKGGKMQMLRQDPPITDDDEIVLDATDQASVQAAYNKVMRNMMQQLTERIKEVRGK